jgi:AcrR family transcriptional regulator
MIVTKDSRPARTSILKRKAPGRPVGNTGSQTRERIVQTAAAMFALQGLQNVSLNQVAGACGLTAPAIYNYFPSKDALYVEIISTMYDEITAAFSKAFTPDGGLFAAIDRVLDVCLVVYRDDQVLQRLGAEAALEAVRAPDRYPEYRAARAKLETLFVGAVEAAVAAGELSNDVDIEETGALLCSLIMSGIGARALQAMSSASEFRRTIEAFRKLMGPGQIRADRGAVTLNVVPASGSRAP